MKAIKGKTHAIFNCNDCNWSAYNYLTSEKLAKKHAKELGHKVTGEIAISVCYNGNYKSCNVNN